MRSIQSGSRRILGPVFTLEDRRKAAAVTNEIRREKRALFEQLRLNREMEHMLAKDAARRKRRAEKQRRRREELKIGRAHV